jgi:3-oxoadipate enol-lactonase
VDALWYIDEGEGPPVVLLHAGVVDSRIWQPVVPLLRERHRVIRYDQRGYGRSPAWDGPYSPVDDLVWVLDAAGVDRAALVGLSRGGEIAIATALERPARVSALVLVASGIPGYPLAIEATPEQEARWDAAEASGDLATLAEIDMEFWAPLGADDELRAMFVANAAASNAEDPAQGEPSADRLGAIAVPTLVITAARDQPVMNEIGEVLAQRIPGARRAVIDEADHMVPRRTPDELADLILHFLR